MCIVIVNKLRGSFHIGIYNTFLKIVTNLLLFAYMDKLFTFFFQQFEIWQ